MQFEISVAGRKKTRSDLYLSTQGRVSPGVELLMRYVRSSMSHLERAFLSTVILVRLKTVVMDR